MEFGALAHIDHVDWALPKTADLSRRFLTSHPSSLTAGRKKLQVFLGAPAWGHRKWVSKIYPTGAKPSDFLKHYAEAFSCIELNTSHYRIPSVDQTEKWLAQVPADFLFCPKLAQSISHSAQGLRDAQLLKEWFSFTSRLGANLGTCFIQFPPHFSYSEKQDLFQFLKVWPDELPLALEFRHPSWFTGTGEILPALTEYLQSRGIGLVITDVAGRRDVLHASLSAPFSFVRFIGNNLHSSDFSRAKLWAAKLREWQDLRLHKVYFMVHEPDDILAPELATGLAREFAASLGQDLKFPRNQLIDETQCQAKFDL